MENELKEMRETAMRRRILAAVSELLEERGIICEAEKNAMKVIFEKGGE